MWLKGEPLIHIFSHTPAHWTFLYTLSYISLLLSFLREGYKETLLERLPIKKKKVYKIILKLSDKYAN